MRSSSLGRQVRAVAESHRGTISSAQSEARPLRLLESNAAEELACFLDVQRPDGEFWFERVSAAIEQTFARDAERARVALLGLNAVRVALAQGAATPLVLAELDSLLHALFLGSSEGALSQR